jgi:hypothetical protein
MLNQTAFVSKEATNTGIDWYYMLVRVECEESKEGRIENRIST